MRSRIVAALVLLALALTGLAGSATAQERSLYERLGRYDAAAAVVDDVIGRMAKDAKFGRFFSGHAADSLGRLRQMIVEQLCAAAGGPCVYTGRSMKASHAGLWISEADWSAAAAHLVASLDRFQAPAREKGEVLAIVGTVKADIVEK